MKAKNETYQKENGELPLMFWTKDALYLEAARLNIQYTAQTPKSTLVLAITNARTIEADLKVSGAIGMAGGEPASQENSSGTSALLKMLHSPMTLLLVKNLESSPASTFHGRGSGGLWRRKPRPRPVVVKRKYQE